VSVPARRLGSPASAPATDRPSRGGRPPASSQEHLLRRSLGSAAAERAPLPRTPAARPQVPSPSHPRRRARRGSPAFWVLAASVITTSVVGIVSVSALLVQTSFRVDDTGGRIASLLAERDTLREKAAELSSPSRVRAWAGLQGMVVPDRVVILRVPATDGGGDAGA
jgi:cell division protein FtsL